MTCLHLLESKNLTGNREGLLSMNLFGAIDVFAIPHTQLTDYVRHFSFLLSSKFSFWLNDPGADPGGGAPLKKDVTD